MKTSHLSSLSPFPQSIDYERRIFTNRNLDLEDVRVVGFDMDYTLAIYKETLKSLTTRLALRQLVDHKGYSADVLDIEYDPRFAIRGLVLDTKTGNVLKRDAHQHVSRVTHGFVELSRDARRHYYPRGSIRVGSKRYVLLDTLFELPEAYLYSRLVEMGEAVRGRRLRQVEYQGLYRDIRAAVDLVHRDGSLKKTVMAHPDRYVERDVRLPAALAQFRSVGKQLFLLTNSEWSYTNAMMSYLLGDALPELPRWQDYFDVVVVFARKPGFFRGREPFLELDEGGTPIGEAKSLRRGMVVQGGNLRDFERMIGLNGDSVLYVGDHIYGDVLRSKKTAAWRTAMIVPELERELRHLRLAMDALRERERLDRLRRSLDDQRLWTRLRLQRLEEGTESDLDVERELGASLEHLQVRLAEVTAQTKDVQAGIDGLFNAYWGMLLKTGHEHSAFGAQIEDYACLYSSRVSNFLFYSPTEYFRTPRDLLPHEHFELFGFDEWSRGLGPTG